MTLGSSTLNSTFESYFFVPLVIVFVFIGQLRHSVVVMLRCKRMKKVILPIGLCFGIIGIVAFCRHAIWEKKTGGPINNPTEINVKTLEMLHPLIENSRDFVESESVRKYFSWPTPEHPRSFNDVTDAKESSYIFLYHDHVYTNLFKINDVLRIRIIARTRTGEQKYYGGDYIRVRLKNDFVKYGIVGTVIDHDDGTYTASIPLLNPGTNLLEVTLIHSSEAVDLIRRLTSSKGSPGLNFRGVFKQSMKEEKTKCNMWFPSFSNASEVTIKRDFCDFSNKRRGLPWFCVKPKNLECSSIERYEVIRTNEVSALLKESGLFEEGINLRAQIGETAGINVFIPNYHIQLDEKPLPSCSVNEAGTIPPHPSGQFIDGKWQSFHCNATNFSLESEKATCLTNKLIYILGDSTIRQWYGYFVKTSLRKWFDHIVHHFEKDSLRFSEVVTAQDIWEPREAIDTHYNITFRFSAHGPPLQNGGSPHSQPYIPDRIDGIKGGEGTIVAFTIGTHLLLYEPSVYVQRLKAIKEAISRLKQRSAETLVVFRSLNIYEMDDFNANQCCISDWLAYRYNTIAKNIFKESKDIIFLDMWDMSASHHTTPSGLHTQPSLVENEISFFLSFVCPDLQKPLDKSS